MKDPLQTGDTQFDGGRGLVVDKDRIGDWMQTWTGKRFYVADPRPEDFDILDIIYALSQSNRYNGHCRFYSRMEHSILVSKIVPQEYAREAFAHDFEECYVPDMHRPLKRTLGKENHFFVICDNLSAAICKRFGLPFPLSQVVKDADTAILHLEKEALFPRSDPWDIPLPRPTGVQVHCYSPEAVMWMGLQRYCELFEDDFVTLRARMYQQLGQDLSALTEHWRRMRAE